MVLFILEACQSWKQLSLPGGGRQLRAWELSQSPPRLSPVLGIVKQMALVWQTWLKEILTKTVMVPNDQAVSRPSLNFLINERCRHHHLPYLVVIIIMAIIIMLIVIIFVITALSSLHWYPPASPLILVDEESTVLQKTISSQSFQTTSLLCSNQPHWANIHQSQILKEIEKEPTQNQDNCLMGEDWEI